MPTNQGFRFYYDQGILPGKEPGEEDKNETGAIIGLSCLYPPFGIKCKLFPEEEILSPQGCAGPDTQRQKSNNIQEQNKRDSQEVV